MHYAAHADDQEIVRQLLDLGADKLALTIDSRTCVLAVVLCLSLMCIAPALIGSPRDLAVKWNCKKMFYSRPEYEIEYERWLYPEKYDAEVKAKEAEVSAHCISFE